MTRVMSMLTMLAVVPPSLVAAERLGEPLQLEGPTAIESILENPEAYVGRRVQVAGAVSGVCLRMGCWMEIESDSEAQIRVKVEDGVLVFPAEAVGGEAIVEGTVEILEMTPEQAVGWLRHQAEERGEEFDAAALGDGPYRLVQLRGLGAEIAAPSPSAP